MSKAKLPEKVWKQIEDSRIFGDSMYVQNAGLIVAELWVENVKLRKFIELVQHGTTTGAECRRMIAESKQRWGE